VQDLQIINDKIFSCFNHDFVNAINEQANNPILLLYSMPATQTIENIVLETNICIYFTL